MASSEHKPGGLIESVRRVAGSAVGLVHNRLQLFSVELQEEKYRTIQALLWTGTGLILIFLGLAMGVGTVAMVVYRQWGVTGLVGLTLLLLIVGVIVVAVMWNRLKSGGAPFSGTLEELKKDSEWLRRRN